MVDHNLSVDLDIERSLWVCSTCVAVVDRYDWNYLCLPSIAFEDSLWKSPRKLTRWITCYPDNYVSTGILKLIAQVIVEFIAYAVSRQAVCLCGIVRRWHPSRRSYPWVNKSKCHSWAWHIWERGSDWRMEVSPYGYLFESNFWTTMTLHFDSCSTCVTVEQLKGAIIVTHILAIEPIGINNNLK